MRVLINEKREVINIVYPEFGELQENEIQVMATDFEIPKKGFNYINDKVLEKVQRYYIDEKDIMHRRTDDEIRQNIDRARWLRGQKRQRFIDETDYLKEKVIEILAKESKDPIVMEWQAKKDKIRGEVK